MPGAAPDPVRRFVAALEATLLPAGSSPAVAAALDLLRDDASLGATRKSPLTGRGVPFEASVSGPEREPALRYVVEAGSGRKFFGPRLTHQRAVAAQLAGHLPEPGSAVAGREVEAFFAAYAPDPRGRAGAVGVDDVSRARARPGPRRAGRPIQALRPPRGRLSGLPTDGRRMARPGRRHGRAQRAGLSGAVNGGRRRWCRGPGGSQALPANRQGARLGGGNRSRPRVGRRRARRAPRGGPLGLERFWSRRVFVCRAVDHDGRVGTAMHATALAAGRGREQVEPVVRALARRFHGNEALVDALAAAGDGCGVPWSFTVIGLGLGAGASGSPKLNIYAAPDRLA